MSSNVFWQTEKISKIDHEKLKGHSSFCLWFTGLSGSGKSTLSSAVQEKLHQTKIHTCLLDGDNVRHGLNCDLGFSDKDRHENIRRIIQVANLFVNAGVVPIVAVISPYREDRKLARETFGENSLIEVFLDCPIDICVKRDPKGLYKKAQGGIIESFTGISSPYELPSNPEVALNTDQMSISECVQIIIDYLKTRGYIPKTEVF